MLLSIVMSVRDNSDLQTGLSIGVPVTGLTPTWSLFKSLSTNTDITPTPTVSEIGRGLYKVSYDPDLNGSAAGQVDAGDTSLRDSDRYIDLVFYATADSSMVNLNPSQSIPTTGNTANTVADALNAARAGAFGKVTIANNIMDLYAPDNTTVVKSFTLNGSSPTQRV